MQKKILKKNALCLFLLCFFFIGCRSTQQRIIDPGVVEELRGFIRISQNSFEVNQPIQVNYWITNISTMPIQEKLVDGSTDPNSPFQTYSFNAVEELDKTSHLELKEAGEPFTGDLMLMPGEEKLFCQNTFVAPKSGAYAFSFFLRWKKDKRIEFKPATINVKDAVVETRQDQDIKKVIGNLASKDPKIKLQAKEKLIEKGVLAVPALIELFEDQNVSLRSDAMFTVISIGKEAVPDLIKACEHKNHEVRMRSVYALGQIGDTSAFPLITNALIHDPEAEVRLTALRFINDTLSYPISIPLLIKALDDNAVLLRKEAILALKNHTNLSFDFNPDDSAIERKKSVDQWKDWWQSPRSNSFKTP
ncbi:MAG: HEAT repeat domain-containing protein [Candidatus Brocadiae bacterium]|nr:HEAT repeat domain-containing protein [Candidatus Brocadiia bacterium]